MISGYLDGVTGEYTPEAYLIDEKEAELFDYFKRNVFGVRIILVQSPLRYMEAIF